jgi:4-coumarate--CoA ligase
MPHVSRWSISIPQCSFPTFLFESPHKDLGDKKAYVDAARPDELFLTRNTFRLWSQRVALGLLKSPGFQKGDRVLVFSGNSLATPVAFMGIAMAGGIFTGANPTFTSRELTNQLRDSGAAYLLCSDASIDTGLVAAEQAGLDKSRVFVYNVAIFSGDDACPSVRNGCRYWGELIASAEAAQGFQWEELDVSRNLLLERKTTSGFNLAKKLSLTSTRGTNAIRQSPSTTPQAQPVCPRASK